ncbi:MAG: hypothetical protein ACRCXT_18265 [Paraclostridium sp.]
MTNEKIPSFLKKDGDSLLFNGEGEFVFYIPEIYFDSKYALIVGEYINLLGVLDYAIFDSNGKSSGLKPFRFPTVFLTKPGNMEKIKNTKLTKHTDSQDYRLLKYKKGDQIVVSTKVPQMVANVEEFYKLFTSGKIPTTIAYNELQNYFMENIRLNGEDYGMTIQLFGIIIGEMVRASAENSKLFRHTIMDNMTGYNMINIKDVPKYVSPFTSITSENWDDSVVNAILLDKHQVSPLEPLFTL